MDFKTAARLGAYLSKDYAYSFFNLLVNYRNLSASEAASRLGLHIRTAQDFLEGLTELGLLNRQEVYEKKRPYYRYTLETDHILIDVDLNSIAFNGVRMIWIRKSEKRIIMAQIFLFPRW